MLAILGWSVKPCIPRLSGPWKQRIGLQFVPWGLIASKVLCSWDSLSRRFFDPKVQCSEVSFGPKCHLVRSVIWSEGSFGILVRRFIWSEGSFGPKGRWSEGSMFHSNLPSEHNDYKIYSLPGPGKMSLDQWLNRIPLTPFVKESHVIFYALTQNSWTHHATKPM